MVLPRIAHRNPVSYYRMLWTAARYSLSRSPQPLRTRRFSLPVPLPFPPISFSLRISVESSTLPTGTMRMAAASLPPRLYASIDTYLPIRAGAMLPISVNKCTPARTYDACRSKPSRFPALRIDAGIRIRFSITRSSEIMTPLRISLYTSWSGEDLYIYSNFWIYNICFRYISTLVLTNFYFCSIVTNVYHSYLGV